MQTSTMNLYLEALVIKPKEKNKFTKGSCGSSITQEDNHTHWHRSAVWDYSGHMDRFHQIPLTGEWKEGRHGYRRQRKWVRDRRIIIWNKTSSTSPGERGDSRRQWKIQRYENGEFHGSKTIATLNGQGEVESSSPTGFAVITAMTIFPFINRNSTGLKIHLWLLPVGCWEKQQLVGKKMGCEYFKFAHDHISLKLLNECYENTLYFWRILHFI